MDASFWHERWQANQIGFHEGDVNALLAAHFDRLDLAHGARVFVPMCGKTRDIAWLLGKGMRVVGAELSEIAVQQLFDELGVEAEVIPMGALTCYSAADIEIHVGDIFELTAEALRPVDAIYDRAALVALPGALRERYAAHLTAISNSAPQLVITFDYDQDVMPGPPFCVPREEVDRLYGAAYQIADLAAVPVAGNLKGIAPAIETIRLLS
ncbi:MAG: thiopurine S-methyltransferase [Paracoccaceae bacterium]